MESETVNAVKSNVELGPLPVKGMHGGAVKDRGDYFSLLPTITSLS